MKIITILGNRPQFIKASVVSNEFKQHTGINEIIVHTGQHYDNNMSDIFFEELGLPLPDYSLNIGSGHHGEQTGMMLSSIEKILLQERPDCVVVYGDTNSTLAGALAASKLHIPIAHIEAGLRSYNRRMPEEINRVLTDQISEHLFAPNSGSVSNLRNEGINSEKIYIVGDVMFDVARYYGSVAEQNSSVLERFRLDIPYVLATIHRAENTDNYDTLSIIMKGLVEISKRKRVVFPIHPRTYRKLIEFQLFDRIKSNLTIIEPQGYLDMLMLERNSSLIVTDSGGVQKEAFYQKVPCVTLRHETEWVELVDLGWNILVPPVSVDAIVDGANMMLDHFQGRDGNPYGSGNSRKLIVERLKSIYL